MRMLNSLCDGWNANYSRLIATESKLQAIAAFHARLLFVHPFLDGNGRVARAILMQQFLDLFGRADMALMSKGTDYYNALQAADINDYDLLVALISPIVRG